jgi:hypothetical protein
VPKVKNENWKHKEREVPKVSKVGKKEDRTKVEDNHENTKGGKHEKRGGSAFVMGF